MATRTHIENRYGVKNVAFWADLDNDQDAADITNRINRSLDMADAIVAGRLAAGTQNFSLPLLTIAGAEPILITDIKAKLAGHDLSSARGTFQYDKDGKPINPLEADRLDAMNKLDMIATGKLIPQ